jgi:hypothetical protein
MAVAKEQIILENNISSGGDVYSLLKDSFKDILQEFLEAELNVSLAMIRTRRVIWKHQTSAMDISKKLSKASLANFLSIFHEIGMENSSRIISLNAKGIFFRD